MSTPAALLCDGINRRLTALPYAYTEGEAEHTLSVGGRQPVQFPVDAGGRVHGGSASWVSMKHRDGAIHEPGLIAALLALAEGDAPMRTVLDVGALYGYVSLVARSLFQDAAVHAFEANPRSYAALVRNIEANQAAFADTVHGHYCALSDVSQEQVQFRVHRMRIEADTPGRETRKGESEHRIDVWSLDDFCRDHSLAPDLIKIDVEGYQAKIVPGALGVIAQHRPVIMLEFDTPGAANDFGVTNREVVRPLMDDGYSLVWGRHRSTTAEFAVLSWADLADRHEVNSLGILVP